MTRGGLASGNSVKCAGPFGPCRLLSTVATRDARSPRRVRRPALRLVVSARCGPGVGPRPCRKSGKPRESAGVGSIGEGANRGVSAITETRCSVTSGHENRRSRPPCTLPGRAYHLIGHQIPDRLPPPDGPTRSPKSAASNWLSRPTFVGSKELPSTARSLAPSGIDVAHCRRITPGPHTRGNSRAPTDHP